MRIKLGIPSLLHDILEYAHIDKKAHKNALIEYITTDSRDCETGDLFIALRGENLDGNCYAREAYSKGAFVISEAQTVGAAYTPDTKLALLNIATGYKSSLGKLKSSIAITGSVGKSTTKEFIKKILGEKYKVHSTHKKLQ